MSFSSLKKSSRDDITQPTHHFKPYPSSAISSYSQNSLPHRRLTSWLPVSSSSQHKNTTVPIPGWFDFFFQVLTKEVVARRPYPARAPLQALSVVGSSSPVFCHLIISESDSPPPRPSIKKVVVRRPSSAHAPSQALSVVESSATRLATSPTSVCSIAATTAISSFPRLPPDSSPDILANLSVGATFILTKEVVARRHYSAHAPLQAFTQPVHHFKPYQLSDPPHRSSAISSLPKSRRATTFLSPRSLSSLVSCRILSYPSCQFTNFCLFYRRNDCHLIIHFCPPHPRPPLPSTTPLLPPSPACSIFFFFQILTKEVVARRHYSAHAPLQALSVFCHLIIFSELPPTSAPDILANLSVGATFLLAKEVVARRPYPARAPLQA
ncbi:hypothetical protein PGT21_029794 [Puccinia graminis f. sp. tritici]|uniref:Uncharacterized protein n=1 Tax=Puccinia graminis f. sp. tritici TaxID=56615 RepID=A0A5B0P2T6_PUCGR|nr:hypothetical protein PGT21_029794 [Puccinia graminis f. sp. tritici]